MSCPRNMIEYRAIFKCRKCKDIVGDMGVHIRLMRGGNGYVFESEELCEHLNQYSNQTKVHKNCWGVCEIIRFEEVKWND